MVATTSSTDKILGRTNRGHRGNIRVEDGRERTNTYSQIWGPSNSFSGSKNREIHAHEVFRPDKPRSNKRSRTIANHAVICYDIAGERIEEVSPIQTANVSQGSLNLFY